jgi:Acetyltransferases, including N-acetylases of ribosomal proteins
MTEDIFLRDWEKTDATQLTLILNDPRINDNFSKELPFPYTISHARVFIGMSNISCNYISKAIECNGSVVGLISLYPQDNNLKYNAEMFFAVAKEHENKGIMSAALKKMLHYSFENFSFERIFANVLESNAASIKVLTKNGFQKEGLLRNSIYKSGEFINNCIFSILRKEVKVVSG